MEFWKSYELDIITIYIIPSIHNGGKYKKLHHHTITTPSTWMTNERQEKK